MADETKRSYPDDNSGSKLNTNEPIRAQEGDTDTVKGVPNTEGTPGYTDVKDESKTTTTYGADGDATKTTTTRTGKSINGK